jgi:hypothetical protein
MSREKSEKWRENSSERQCYKTGTILLMYTIGASIRYWLIFSRYQSIIGNHIEVSTPLNSWKRVSEGLYLQSKGINPYEGDLLHEAPIIMLLYQTLTRSLNLPVEIMFLITDLATAVVLYFCREKVHVSVVHTTGTSQR